MAKLTDDELNQIEHGLNMRRDFGGTDKDRMLSHIRSQQRELDVAKAEMEQRAIRSGRTYDAFVALKAENERLTEALGNTAAKAELGAKMCWNESIAEGFRVIAEYARKALADKA